MKRVESAVAVCALAWGLSPPAGATPGPANRDTSAWLGRVGIARVLVEARRDRVRTITELTLPATPAAARRLVLFSSYGAPGPPLALAAELLATPPGYLSAPESAHGEGVSVRFSATAPRSTAVVLGRSRMAGSTLDIPRETLVRALAASGSATLRIAAVRAMPPPSADGSHELLVRLGTERGIPLVLGSVEVRGAHVTRRSARLCEREGHDVPLTVLPVIRHDAARTPPPLAKRTRRDALCVRLWLD